MSGGASNIYDQMKKGFLEAANPENWGFGRSMIAMLLLGFFAVLIPYQFLGGFLPSRLTWVKDNFILISAIAGVAIAGICAVSTKDAQEAMRMAVKISGFVAIGIIVIAIIASLSPDNSKDLAQLKEALSNGGLNESQVSQVEDLIAKDDRVSLKDLNEMGLTTNQALGVLELLEKNGYATREDVVTIYKTMNAQEKIYQQETATAVAGATATAVFTTCYLEVEPLYSDVPVRKLPIKNSEMVDTVKRGERLVALARSDGTMNVNMMWLVELKHGETTIRGWVGSWATIEINEPACVLLPGY